MLRALSVSSVLALLVLFTAGAQTPAIDDDAALRTALEEYLATANVPDPEPIDATLFAPDIEGFWSNGRTHRGQEAWLKAMQDTVDEVESTFAYFAAEADDVNVHRNGDFAWVTCRIEFNGILTEGRGAYRQTVRTTFVFEKRDDRWQMVHEHSSRLPDQE